MVKIVCYISTLSVFNVSRGLAEVVPNAGPAAVFVGGPLDLISGCGDTPSKVLREIMETARCEVISFVINCGFQVRDCEFALPNEAVRANLVEEAIKFPFFFHSVSYDIGEAIN